MQWREDPDPGQLQSNHQENMLFNKNIILGLYLYTAQQDTTLTLNKSNEHIKKSFKVPQNQILPYPDLLLYVYFKWKFLNKIFFM
jgi:hypothetical protein